MKPGIYYGKRSKTFRKYYGEHMWSRSSDTITGCTGSGYNEMTTINITASLNAGLVTYVECEAEYVLDTKSHICSDNKLLYTGLTQSWYYCNICDAKLV